MQISQYMTMMVCFSVALEIKQIPYGNFHVTQVTSKADVYMYKTHVLCRVEQQVNPSGMFIVPQAYTSVVDLPQGYSLKCTHYIPNVYITGVAQKVVWKTVIII